MNNYTFVGQVITVLCDRTTSWFDNVDKAVVLLSDQLERDGETTDYDISDEEMKWLKMLSPVAAIGVIAGIGYDESDPSAWSREAYRILSTIKKY